MQPDERDAGYLWDMLDSARTIRHFVAGVSFHQYQQDKKLQLAVERAIEIIGEAARHVSEAFRKTHSEIPWQGIIAQRNVLAHEYGETLKERIWKAATTRISNLLKPNKLKKRRHTIKLHKHVQIATFALLPSQVGTE